MKYSIITINYNNKDGLKKTIESVINQSCKDFEYIIIDGGSTDGSVDVIRQYADRINYWISEPDKGVYNAMNKGVAQAHGEYLNFMNSGDWFYNNDVLKDVFPHLDSDIVTGQAFYENKIHGFFKQNITMLDFFKGSLEHQATFIRKNLFSNKLYDESFKIISDWKFFVETLIYDHASFHSINVLVCNFDTTGISRSHQLIEEEGKIVFDELFPKRIQEDYFKWKKNDSPLCDLVAEFNHTAGFQKVIKIVLQFLIKVKRVKDTIS